jgi:hypothetical protein
MPEGYELRTTSEFDRKAEAYAGSLKRWDEIARAYDHVLRQNPHLGEPIADTSLRAITIWGKGQLTIYYQVDEESKVVTAVDIFDFTSMLF